MLETPSELYLRKNFTISAGMMEGLNRINQTGAEQARHVLASFLGQETEVAIDSISILPLTMLSQRLRQPDRPLLGCHVRIFGELQAELYCYMQDDHARQLIGAILRRRVHARNMGSMEYSALAEFTNVLANAYWLALHGHVPLNWRTTVPAVVNRIDRVFALASRIGHYDFLAFHTDLCLADLGARLYFCLIPGADCLNRFLQSLEAEHLHPLVGS